MKKLFLFLTALLLTTGAMAQAPEKMSYQAVIRDASNALVTNQDIGMQISILQGDASGAAVYVEVQFPTTNANGLVRLEIGAGIVISGAFNAIDWSNGPYFIKTETDPAGGTDYTITGTSQLMSVPYALHAQTADNVTSTPYRGIMEVQTDLATRTFGNSWGVGPTFATVNGFKAGSKVKLSYHVPCRNNSASWGGAYIEPQISFDGGTSWNSLGSSGFDGGVMVRGDEAIGSYSNTLLVDPSLSSPFSVTVRLFYRSRDGTLTVNGSHDINHVSETAPLMSGINGEQHYTKIIIEEIPD